MSSDESQTKMRREDWSPHGPTGPSAEEMAVEHRESGHESDPLNLELVSKCPLCYADGLNGGRVCRGGGGQ